VLSAEHAAWLRRTLFHGLVLAGLIVGAYILLIAAPTKGVFGVDAIAYWRVDLADPYRYPWIPLLFFPYSPAIAALFTPLAQLPWPVFAVIWWSLLVGALVWLGRRDVLILAAFPPVAISLSDGNIHLLLAVALVVGMRYPAAWAFVLLTKVTPGIGLLWFVARREWRSLAVALGATAVVVAVTAVFLPSQWLGWLAMLRDSTGITPMWPALPVPLWLRLPVAAGIVWWGARRSALWTVPLAATLALPALWLGGLAMLVACWPLRSAGAAKAHGVASGRAPDASRPADADQPANAQATTA